MTRLFWHGFCTTNWWAYNGSINNDCLINMSAFHKYHHFTDVGFVDKKTTRQTLSKIYQLAFLRHKHQLAFSEICHVSWWRRYKIIIECHIMKTKLRAEGLHVFRDSFNSHVKHLFQVYCILQNAAIRVNHTSRLSLKSPPSITECKYGADTVQFKLLKMSLHHSIKMQISVIGEQCRIMTRF